MFFSNGGENWKRSILKNAYKNSQTTCVFGIRLLSNQRERNGIWTCMGPHWRQLSIARWVVWAGTWSSPVYPKLEKFFPFRFNDVLFIRLREVPFFCLWENKHTGSSFFLSSKFWCSSKDYIILGYIFVPYKIDIYSYFHRFCHLVQILVWHNVLCIKKMYVVVHEKIYVFVTCHIFYIFILNYKDKLLYRYLSGF